MRLTHEAQVIPSMGRTISIGWLVILPGSIQPRQAGAITTDPAPAQVTT